MPNSNLANKFSFHEYLLKQKNKAMSKTNFKTIALLMLLVTSFSCSKDDDNQQSTTIVIPDTNFEQILIDLSHDTNGLTGDILRVDAEKVNMLDVRNKNINTLQGIEGFINLISLSCDNNELTSLNVSNNALLKRLYCDHNDLTNLDVTNNLALENLICDNNQLSSIDISNNSILERLIVHHNVLTSLDVSHNPLLQKLDCFNNQIESLDLSNNSELTYMTCALNSLTRLNAKNGNNTGISFFQAKNNPYLTCVEVDNVAYSTNNWADRIDPIASYSIDCN